MLAEFVQKIINLAGPTIEVPPWDPRVAYVKKPGGEVERLVLPAPARDHAVAGLGDLVQAARTWGDGEFVNVFHDGVGVRAVLDSEREDFVTIALKESQRFKLLRELAAGRSFKPPQLVKFLRFNLHGSNLQALVAALARVSFSRKSDGSYVAEHGRESLGRSVEGAVDAVLPEAFQVRVPVYTNPGCDVSVSVSVGLYINTEQQELEIMTLADEIERAIDQAQTEIHRLLVEELPQATVLRGAF